MKELKKEDLQITELIHRFVREHVEAGDICIDATAGCGNDTLFLCELTGARGEVTKSPYSVNASISLNTS